MTARTVGGETDLEVEETLAGVVEAMGELAVAQQANESPSFRERLPWIGALCNPRLGPIVVVDESGYLVPLCTASDLLRGCRFFWHRSQD